MKKLIPILAVVSLIVFSNTALAKPDFQDVLNTRSNKVISVPEKAIEVANNVFYLGETFDAQSGKMVTGYAFVHKKENGAKPDHAGGPKNNGGSSGSTCYAYMASGAKWKTTEPWMMDGSNEYFSANDAISLVESGIAKWESAAGNTNIIGNRISAVGTLEADMTSTDGKNEVYFDQIADANTIGLTIVWGIFGGRPSGRELVEWDQIYNTDYAWSIDETSNTMDFESIATHELGHTFGLADLYTSDCVDETMFGYADYNETNKRDLNAGDIAGISKLY